MGLLDFFKSKKKSQAESVKTKNPLPEQTFFANTVLEIISPTVENFGFKKHRSEIEEYFTTIVFRKRKQYIKISGTTYPTDYPYSYNIFLGEGDSENFLESDWNTIALWQLKCKIDPSAIAQSYDFPSNEKMKFSIENADRELIKYGDTFLHGDLSLFHETRSEQTKNREPYKIYKQDQNGKYVIFDDQKSVKQKNKYR